MPDLSMEAFCIMICAFMVVILFIDKSFNSKSSLHVLFLKMAGSGLLNLIFEVGAIHTIVSKGELSLVEKIGFLELYYNSLLVFFYFAVIYSVKMLNQSLPSLKKIGNKINYFVIAILVIMDVCPLLALNWDGVDISFKPFIYLVFVAWGVVEIVMLYLFLKHRKYMNEKRLNIMSLGYISRVATIIMTIVNPYQFFMSIGVALTTMTSFLTLENNDVHLIDQLEVEKDKADAANKAKSSFIANVSHEIRTPINAILGMDEIVIRETKDTVIRQYANDIKSAAQILHSIINEILDMSKIESGKMELVPVNYNMRSLINDTINIIQLKMDAKQLKFNVEVDASIPAGYFGDEVRLRQILSNILSNAVKYTNEGSVTMVVTGEKLLNSKELLKFKISDIGIGMTKENLDSLFEKFTRFDAEKNRNVEGTGLGMPITNQFLSMMGSKLNVESEYGKGSVFSFELEQTIWDETPLGDFRKIAYKSSQQNTYESSFVASETKVLVVDDNAINRKVFKGLLKETELIIDEAESGPECLNMVRKNKYDIIFMDHMMPDMDGIETFHQLKAMEDNLSIDAPVIMLTANAVVGAQDVYLEEGFDDFMAKPIIPEKLEELIKKYL